MLSLSDPYVIQSVAIGFVIIMILIAILFHDKIVILEQQALFESKLGKKL